MATYGAISSQFHSLTEGAWLVTSYNLGYCVSLPVVSLRFYAEIPIYIK